MIIGHGASQPQLMFIADHPIGDDFKSNYAISGYQQNLLNGFCKRAHLDPGLAYYTCLIKEEPKVKGMDKVKPDEYLEYNKPLIDRYASILTNEITVLQPFLLAPLGELSFNWLTGLRGIRKFRGSVLSTTNFTKLFKVMPILGPYPFIYQDPKQDYITRIDFNKIPACLNDGPPPDNLYNIWICKTPGALRSFIERSYKPDGLLVFDIETYMGIPTCISFCFDGFESVCVPLLDWSIDLDVRALMMHLVAKLLVSPIRKVNQNIKYDWKILERWGFRVCNVIGDTMLAASTLYCEFPKNLGFLTSIYTDLPYFKDEGRQFNPTRHKKEQFYLYNAKDSLATYQIYYKQMDEVREQGVGYVYENLIQLMPIYRRMEDRGILIDPERRQLLLAKYTNLYEIEVTKLKQLLGMYELNPLSHVQMRRLIYEELGYKPVRGIKKTKSGDYKADEDSIELLLAAGEHRSNLSAAVLRSILACRKFHKVIEILELELYPDGRFRCEFNLSGTETGRTSAGSTTDELILPNDKGKLVEVTLGHSLQTIGKHGFEVDGEIYGRDIRTMFVPTPGYRFVEIDLAGAEARVDAILAGNTDLSYFDNPGIHKLTGSWCFDCKPEDIDKKALVPFGESVINRYHVAKQVRHAGERNIQAMGLVTKLLWGFTVKQGEILLKKFHDKDPNIRKVFHYEIKEALRKQRCLIAPNGRRRDFFGRIDDEHTINEAISFLPQAIVSDQTKFAGILRTSLSTGEWAHLLTEQHDGALYEVPIGREQEFYEQYQKNVERAIDFSTCTVARKVELSIPSEISVGDDWYNMEEVKTR